MVVREQALHQVTADEAGATSNNDSPDISPSPSLSHGSDVYPFT
jgi:hypothetical protein